MTAPKTALWRKKNRYNKPELEAWNEPAGGSSSSVKTETEESLLLDLLCRFNMNLGLHLLMVQAIVLCKSAKHHSKTFTAEILADDRDLFSAIGETEMNITKQTTPFLYLEI